MSGFENGERLYEPGWRCRNCPFMDIEHDPIDMRCPDDEDEARANREEVTHA